MQQNVRGRGSKWIWPNFKNLSCNYFDHKAVFNLQKCRRCFGWSTSDVMSPSWYFRLRTCQIIHFQIWFNISLIILMASLWRVASFCVRQLPHFYVMVNRYVRQMVDIHQVGALCAPTRITNCPLHYPPQRVARPQQRASEFIKIKNWTSDSVINLPCECNMLVVVVLAFPLLRGARSAPNNFWKLKNAGTCFGHSVSAGPACEWHFSFPQGEITTHDCGMHGEQKKWWNTCLFSSQEAALEADFSSKYLLQPSGHVFYQKLYNHCAAFHHLAGFYREIPLSTFDIITSWPDRWVSQCFGSSMHARGLLAKPGMVIRGEGECNRIITSTMRAPCTA